MNSKETSPIQEATLYEKFLSFYKLMSGFNEDDRPNLVLEEGGSSYSDLVENTRKAIVNFLVAVLKPFENTRPDGIAKKAAEINSARNALKTLILDSVSNKTKYADLMKGFQHKNANWFYDSLQIIANLKPTTSVMDILAKKRQEEWIKETKIQFQQQMPNQPITQKTVTQFLTKQITPTPPNKEEVKKSKQGIDGEQACLEAMYLGREVWYGGSDFGGVVDINHIFDDETFKKMDSKRKGVLISFRDQQMRNIDAGNLTNQEITIFGGSPTITSINDISRQRRLTLLYLLERDIWRNNKIFDLKTIYERCAFHVSSAPRLFGEWTEGQVYGHIKNEFEKLEKVEDPQNYYTDDFIFNALVCTQKSLKRKLKREGKEFSTDSEETQKSSGNFERGGPSWIANSGETPSSHTPNIEGSFRVTETSLSPDIGELFKDLQLEPGSIVIECNNSQITILIRVEEEGNSLFEKIKKKVQSLVNQFRDSSLITNLSFNPEKQSLILECKNEHIARALEKGLTELLPKTSTSSVSL